LRALISRPFLLAAVLSVSVLAGCSWFRSPERPAVPLPERPRLCILTFGMDLEIRRLTSVKSRTDKVNPSEEARLVAEAVQEIRTRARRILHDRLAGREHFDVVSLEQTDQAMRRLGIDVSHPLSRDQLAGLQRELAVDIVLGGTILDYGKIRWQWAAAGMLGDLTWESVVIGLATGWNPVVIFANVGFELLTSTPVWFGGSYLFGLAFRPVRVEAWAIDPVVGDHVWSEMEAAVYVGKALQEVPKEERKKKEVQLGINLKRATEALGDALIDAKITKTTLWEHRLPAGGEMGRTTRQYDSATGVSKKEAAGPSPRGVLRPPAT
jgi:hypothetical protein